MNKHPDFKVPPSTAGPLKLVVAKAVPSRLAMAKTSSAKPATTLLVATNSVVVATLIAFPANVLYGSEAGMIEVLKPRTYNILTALSHEYFSLVHWNPHDEEFFVIQVQAAQAATGAPVVFDLGSNDNDDVPTSKQCILDSDSEDNAAEHCCKKQHNANAKWLLANNAEKSKLGLKHLNNTVPGHLSNG
ncbi:hypothetical protein C0989_010259 [Termitomyces sp. Mn162]|nr:hypothetical protein C0989_010259 [Termitomyces sp. Mn162]